MFKGLQLFINRAYEMEFTQEPDYDQFRKDIVNIFKYINYDKAFGILIKIQAQIVVKLNL